MVVNILNIGELQERFNKLKPEAKPLFGKMTPQHVIEHLANVVKVSSGKIVVKLYLPSREAEALKQKIIYSDVELPMGIKNPTMGEELPTLKHSNMGEAFNELFEEINYFEKNGCQNPHLKNMHPRMGELNYGEWLKFHSKHFLHHFKQYGLV